MFNGMFRMEKLCTAIGFPKDMIESLLIKKEAIRCSGKIYSEGHRRKFGIKNDIFRAEKHPPDSSKLVLTINRSQLANGSRNSLINCGMIYVNQQKIPKREKDSDTDFIICNHQCPVKMHGHQIHGIHQGR